MFVRKLLKNFIQIQSVQCRHKSEPPQNAPKYPNIKVKLEYKDIDKTKYDSIIKKDADPNKIKSRIDEILKVYEYVKYNGGHIPSDISVEQMEGCLKTRDSRELNRYFRFLFLTESRKIRDKIKKQIKVENTIEYKGSLPEHMLGIFDDSNELKYGLWNNTIVSRLGASNTSRIRTERALRNAALFGSKVIIDLDYDDLMSFSEANIQIRHIMTCLLENIVRPEPFDIYFTNCDPNKTTMRTLLNKYSQTTPLKQMSIEGHFFRDNYLEHFPKERLVYLSPDAREVMKSYDPDDIYIVGGFLDKSSLNIPASFLKAKRDGIRQYRLPLDENVRWASGPSKHLCIMHIISILNDIRYDNDWRRVLLKNLPKRKVKSDDVQFEEDEKRRMMVIKRRLDIEQFKIFTGNDY